MNPDDLLAEAASQTGLDDFGAPTFREGLDAYCESVADEAQLNDIGAIAIPANAVGSLANRLRVVDWAKQHPEVAAERVAQPLVVISMFRAGTTLLSNLLDCDPANRALLRWEAADSVPPATPESFRTGPRVDAVRASAAMLDEINPLASVAHHEDAAGPTECVAVLSQDFKSLLWEAITNVPSYSEWLLATDHRSAYEYHRLALQVLQHGGVRGQWTLKSPHHAIALDALTAVYPDARLVILHRDPAALCGSVCSLIRILSSTFSDADHRAYIAHHWTQLLETSVSRVDAFRATHPEVPIVDVVYDDFVRGPVATVGSIYGAFGMTLAPAAADAMRAHLDTAPRFGPHRYDLAEFGLDPRDIAERFAAYTDRYLKSPEGAGSRHMPR